MRKSPPSCMWAFSNYSVVQRIILFQSGTSHKMLMVTSLWHVRMLHPCGLVPNFWRLWCQFRGGWSQPIANLTSEFDSNTFAGEETQHHLSYFFFSSLTTDVNRVSQNPRVPASHGEPRTNGVRIHFIICFWFFVNFPFVTRYWEWLLWRKVTKRICGSFIVYNYEGQFNEFCILWFCGSVAL